MSSGLSLSGGYRACASQYPTTRPRAYPAAIAIIMGCPPWGFEVVSRWTQYTGFVFPVNYLREGDSKIMAGSGKPTRKQRKFAEGVIAGESLADSYREAYDAEGSSGATIRREAHRVSALPHVATMVETARQGEARAAERNLGLRRRWIVGRLVEEADAAPSDSARVRALELLAKQAGLFDSEAERSEKRLAASESELVAELESRLGALAVGEATEIEKIEDPPTPLETEASIPHTSHRDLHIESPLIPNTTPLGDPDQPLGTDETPEDSTS